MSNIWDGQNGDGFEEVEEMIENNDSPQFSHLTQEVMRRFERAKLYETLLKHQLFAPGSADPDTIDLVENEIKAFVIERIETLMGIRQQQAAAASEFTPEEVEVLRMMAARLIAKNAASATSSEPSLHAPPVPAEPTIRMVQARPRPNNGQPSRTVMVGKQTEKKQTRRKKSANISPTTGQDLSQATNPNALPMPSPEAINAITTQQANNIMSSGKAMIGDSQGLNLGNIVSAVVSSRAGIKEEE